MAMRLIRLLACRCAAEPSAERAVRLMPQPQPGQFDRGAAGARIARLADALLAVDPAAVPRTGRQPEIAPTSRRLRKSL